MELVQNNEPYENIYSRLEVKDTPYYFGVFNVMFGARIRAGRYGEGFVDLDWCCGSDSVVLAKTYMFLQRHLERWNGEGNPFENLPTCSMVKPLHHDKEFLNKVGEIIPEFNEIQYVEH